jgi:uncharacterized protein YegP (UPF0339 family)
MATATRKVRADRPVARDTRDVTESASLEFLVYRDNGSDYHWEIVGEHGESLAQCGSFSSYEDAERAAQRVHDGAGSARLEPHVTQVRQLRSG